LEGKAGSRKGREHSARATVEGGRRWEKAGCLGEGTVKGIESAGEESQRSRRERRALSQLAHWRLAWVATGRVLATLDHDGVGGDAPSTVFVYSSIDVCFLRELNDGGEGGRQLGKAAAIDPMGQASVVAVHVPPLLCVTAAGVGLIIIFLVKSVQVKVGIVIGRDLRRHGWTGPTSVKIKG